MLSFMYLYLLYDYGGYKLICVHSPTVALFRFFVCILWGFAALPASDKGRRHREKTWSFFGARSECIFTEALMKRDYD
jgi:hypothetical protein